MGTLIAVQATTVLKWLCAELTERDCGEMEWKEKGNDRFKAGDFAAALQCYSKAIEVDKENAVLYR